MLYNYNIKWVLDKNFITAKNSDINSSISILKKIQIGERREKLRK